MIFATLLALQTAALPTLTEVWQLPPSVAGELVLRGEQHGSVTSLAEVKEIMIPNLRKIHLVEEASASGNRCQRKRWTATFRDIPDDERTAEILTDVYSTTEIRLSHAGTCPADHYVHLNPSVSSEQGFAALVALKEIQSGARNVEFNCTDRTSSNLCTDPETIRRELNRLSPWVVSRTDGVSELWLGTPGQTVTVIRLDPAIVQFVKGDRHFPAPF